VSADSRSSQQRGGLGRWLAFLRGHSLLRNSGFLMGTTITTSLFGYLYWGIAAHTYDPRTVGLASALVSVFGLTSFIGAMGVASINVRMLPALRHSRSEWNIFFTASMLAPTAVTAAFALAVASVLAVTDDQFALLRQPAIFAAFVAGAAMTTSSIAMDATFVALRRSDHHLVRNTTFAVVKIPLLAAPLMFVADPGVLGVLLSWDVALALSLVLALTVLLRRSRPGYRPRLEDGARRFLAHGKALLGYQLETLGGMLPAYVLPPIIVAIAGPDDAAVFYYSWSIGAFFFGVSSSIADALFAEGANQAELRQQTRHALLACAGLLGPAIIVVMFFAPRILEVFGSFYADRGATILRLCLLASIPDAVTNIWVALLLVRGRVRPAATLNWSMALTTVTGSLVLLPRLGLAGVGVAWVIGQSLGAIAVALPLLRMVLSNDAATTDSSAQSTTMDEDEDEALADAARTRRPRVVLVHNQVVPYRLPVFEEMAKAVDLTVLFCMGIANDRRWTPSLEGVSFMYRRLRGRRVGLLVLNVGVWRELRRARPDVYVLVDNHENLTTLALAALHARLRSRPVVLWSEQVPKTPRARRVFAAQFPRLVFPVLEQIMRVFRRCLYTQSRVILSKSGTASDDFLHQAGVDRGKVMAGRQTMPASQLAEASDLPERFSGLGPYLLYLGYFRREKGVHELVDAFLEADTGELTLVLAGSGPGEELLRRQAAASSRIVFAGHADAALKASLLAHAEALVVPSIYEAWGLVVNEALFYGTPVLYRSTVPAAQLVHEGGGLAFEDDDGLTRCLTRVAYDPMLRARLRSEVAMIPHDVLVDAGSSARALLQAIEAASSMSSGRRRAAASVRQAS